jgi:hypothetical protein
VAVVAGAVEGLPAVGNRTANPPTLQEALGPVAGEEKAVVDATSKLQMLNPAHRIRRL